MARFLLTVWPLQTHLSPFMAVAHGLRRRQHEVAFYTGGSASATVEREGFKCIPFQAVDEIAVNDAIRGITSRSWQPWKWQRFLLSTVPAQLRDLETICDAWTPHALVCDMAMWGPILVLQESRKIPTAVLSHVAACLLPGPENPFPGMRWLLNGSPLRPIGSVIAKILRLAARGVPRKASALRETYGLPPLLDTVTEFTGRLPLYLVPGTSEFDGQRRDLPPCVRYVGPCLWDKNQDQPAPQWVAAVPRDRPCVLVAEGTIYRDDPVLLRSAARGLANSPVNVILLAGQGRNLASLDLGSLAANVRLESWAPLSDVLPIADVVVATGNSETAMAAISRKVPMIVVPMILDEPEISFCVVNSGAGLRISSRRCSPAHLATAVEVVLKDKQFRENTARLSAAISGCTGGNRAAELLETLVRPR